MKKTEQFKRSFETAKERSEDIELLKLLPGKWVSKGNGFNMIALPFQDATFKFRILMNQYNEELQFTTVSKNVENRGLMGILDNSDNPFPGDDQFIVALDYQQSIWQTRAEDTPDSGGLADVCGKAIHHEPGLWLYMKDLRTIDNDIKVENGEIKIEKSVLDVARLATIPHGNSVLALGTAELKEGMPDIPSVSGLPIGRFEDLSTPEYDFLTDPYLAPYKHYIENPFMGDLSGVPEFPGFNPRDMNEILRFMNQGVEIERTTVLTVDTMREDAGILNIPFIKKQAEPVSMKSTFWIQELKEKDENGHPKLRLQYSQVIILDFFRPREDGHSGPAKWPHISINTLEKDYCGVIQEPSKNPQPCGKP